MPKKRSQEDSFNNNSSTINSEGTTNECSFIVKSKRFACEKLHQLAPKIPYYEKLLIYEKNVNCLANLPEFINKLTFPFILEYLQNGSIELNQTIIYEIFIAADFLLLDDLKKLCTETFEEMVTNDYTNAILLWINSKLFYWPKIESIALNAILTNFEKIIFNDLFMELSVNDLTIILNHEELDVEEGIILNSIAIWASYNLKSRIKCLPYLLTCCDKQAILADTNEPRQRSSCLPLYALLKNTLYDEDIYFRPFPRLPSKAIMVLGGYVSDQDKSTALIQLFDINYNRWNELSNSPLSSSSSSSSSSNLPTLKPQKKMKTRLTKLPPRTYHACILIGHRIYLLGGYDGNNVVKTVIYFDLQRDHCGWRVCSLMNEKRFYHTVVHLNKRIYVMGGFDGYQRLSSCESYSPRLNDDCDDEENYAGGGDGGDDVDNEEEDDNSWHYIAAMNTVRSDAAAAVCNDFIYVCGGFDGRVIHSSVEYYSPSVNQWTFVANMTSNRGGLALICHQQCLYAIGGNNGFQRVKSIEQLDLSSSSSSSSTTTTSTSSKNDNKWIVVGEMSEGRSNMDAALLGNDIFIVGGWSGESAALVDLVEKFHIEINENGKKQMTIDRCAQMPVKISGATALAIVDKNILHNYIRR